MTQCRRKQGRGLEILWQGSEQLGDITFRGPSVVGKNLFVLGGGRRLEIVAGLSATFLDNFPETMAFPWLSDHSLGSLTVFIKKNI